MIDSILDRLRPGGRDPDVEMMIKNWNEKREESERELREKYQTPPWVPEDCPFTIDCPGNFTNLGPFECSGSEGELWKCTDCDQAFVLLHSEGT